MIQDKVKYPFLEQYVEYTIDETKLKLLTMIAEETNLSTFLKEKYVVTTMLIQLAIDMHETVPVSNDGEKTIHKTTERQLKVLAGDYYSGLFYLMISEIEDIHFIKWMAQTIRDISELKMKRYYVEVDSFQSYLQLEKEIESLLITRFSEYITDSTSHTIYEDLLISSKLIREKINYSQKKKTTLLDRWMEKNEKDLLATCLQEVDRFINHCLKTLNAEVNRMPDALRKHYQIVINDLLKLHECAIGED